MDACLIAGGQRAEHYEIAAYGMLVAWANVMGHNEAADLLEEILEEEKATDEKLTALEGGINQAAADEAHPAEEDKDEGEGQEDEDEEPTRRATAKKKAASKAKAGSRRWRDGAVVDTAAPADDVSERNGVALNHTQSFIFAAVRPAPHRPLFASDRLTNGHSLTCKPRNFLNNCCPTTGVKPFRIWPAYTETGQASAHERDR